MKKKFKPLEAEHAAYLESLHHRVYCDVMKRLLFDFSRDCHHLLINNPTLFELDEFIEGWLEEHFPFKPADASEDEMHTDHKSP